MKTLAVSSNGHSVKTSSGPVKLDSNLEKLFGREVDLVEEQTLRNTILINSIKNVFLVMSHSFGHAWYSCEGHSI